MADATSQSSNRLPNRVRIWGTIFLVFQLLFAANSYGPQRIPGLDLLFDEPWVEAAHDPRRQEVPTGATTSSPIRLVDGTEEAGLDAFRRARFHDETPRYLTVMGGGVAVGDVDGDGRDDLFFTDQPSFAPNASETRSALFRSLGDGTFEEITAEAGLDSVEGHPQGALFFDYDNDGDQDLYVAAYEGGQLFENGGGGIFEDVTERAGLDLEDRCGKLPCYVSSATTADYDRDGNLDLLLVPNVDWDIDDPDDWGENRLFPAFFEPQSALLFRNEGDGTFTEVSTESGLTNEGGKGLSAIWLDVNNDRWPDVYIANDMSRNSLYLNQGDGTFRNVAVGAGVGEVKSSMGVAAGDLDHDGHPELATTNLQGTKISLFRHQGHVDPVLFEYRTEESGLASSSRISGWGLQFVDLDLDGHLDLAASGGPIWRTEDDTTETRNLVYRNRGDGTFEEITAASGLPHTGQTSRGLAVLDANQNGRPDLLYSNADGAAPLLLENRPRADARGLKVRLVGTDSNRDGVGAGVTVERTDGLRMQRTVRAGGSYQSARTKALFFGLGDADVARLTVTWPAGTTDTLRALPEGPAITIREGTGLLAEPPS